MARGSLVTLIRLLLLLEATPHSIAWLLLEVVRVRGMELIILTMVVLVVVEIITQAGLAEAAPWGGREFLAKEMAVVLRI